MTEPRTLLIDGDWVSAERTIDVRYPYDGRVVGAVSDADEGQALRALQAAKAYAFDLTAFERAEILRETSTRVEAQAMDFARSIVLESGLCLKDARREVERAVTFLRYCAEEARRLDGDALPTDVTAEKRRSIAITMREPVGVVAAITPFNRPLNQVAVKVGPAIAAGNAVVLKPSEKTPLTAIKFVKTLIECGLPAKAISVLTGRPEKIGNVLLKSGLVDMITFTGSSAVGKRLAEAAGMVRLLLELGDSGALIVSHDADLVAAAKAAVAGAVSTSGQSCRGVKRIIVVDSVADAFVDRVVTGTLALRTGDPMDAESDVGCLISEEAATAVEQRVTEAVRAGAKLACGGQRKGSQYWPTVLDRVDPKCALVQEETFGPCAPVIRVKDFDEAIRVANDTAFGLQTGVFTASLERAFSAVRRIKTGTVVVNNGPQFESPKIPFGGVKASGLGREGVRYAIQEMTVLKTAVFNLGT